MKIEYYQSFADDYDWQQAFEYSEFALDDIEEVISSVHGEKDEDDWLLLAKLKNGNYGGLRAGCDYTGWD
jgi:hypothetical protein